MAKLGMLIDRMFILRENKDTVNKELKGLNSQLDILTEEIIQELDAADIEKAAGTRGSVTKKVELHPGMENKEKFYRWVVEKDKFEFVQARVNAAPVREMLEQLNSLPPGVNTYTRVRLNVRKK